MYRRREINFEVEEGAEPRSRNVGALEGKGPGRRTTGVRRGTRRRDRVCGVCGGGGVGGWQGERKRRPGRYIRGAIITARANLY